MSQKNNAAPKRRCYAGYLNSYDRTAILSNSQSLRLADWQSLRLSYKLLSGFFRQNRPAIERFKASLPYYLKLCQRDGEVVVINEAVLHKLSNPDQLPSHNALCAYFFSHPQVAIEDYSRGGTEDGTCVWITMLDHYCPNV